MIRSNTRLTRRSSADLRAIARATKRIEELSVILDRQINADARPEEQLRHLRQATGQITRTANDAIQAYRRVSHALRTEADQADADRDEVERASRNLAEARAKMLSALEVASQRYPWAEPWRPAAEERSTAE